MHNDLYFLLVGRPDAGTFEYLNATGEVGRIGIDRLAEVATGNVLVFGTADPVNGSTDADDRAAILAGPRRWLLTRFLSNKPMLAQLIAAGVLLNLCAFVMSFFQRAVYDRVIPNLALDSLWALSAGVALALAFEFALRQIRSDFVDVQGLQVAQLVQIRVMSALLECKARDAPRNTGAVLVAMRDLESMALIVPNAIGTFLVDIPFFFIFVFITWLIAGPVAAVVAFGGIMVAFIGIASIKGMGRGGARNVQLMRARNNLIVDSVEGLTTLKANQAEGALMKQWATLSDHAALNGRDARRWSDGSVAATTFVVQLVTVLALIVGVLQVKDGSLSVGGLIAATLLAGRAMAPITTAIGLLSRAHQSLSQFREVAQLLALPPERADPKASLLSAPRSGSYSMRGLGVTYERAPLPALQGVALSIASGERIAVIGKSGSGKSSLLQLMAGLIEPTDGSILIDGSSLSHYSAANLRATVAYAAQDSVLFDGSLRDNVTLGLTRVNPAALERAVRVTGLDAVANALPEGFATIVGPRGAPLSGGQKQAVLLARALVRPAKVVLLDEPTAAMDVATEGRIIAGLKEVIGAGQTLVMATHRLELLSLVDRVLWLEGGRLIADKPVAEVLAILKGKGRAA